MEARSVLLGLLLLSLTSPRPLNTQEMGRLREEIDDLTELLGHVKEEASEAEAERDALGAELEEARRHLAAMSGRVAEAAEARRRREAELLAEVG